MFDHDKSPNSLTITYYNYGELYDIVCFMVYRTTSWDLPILPPNMTQTPQHHRAPSCPVKALGPHGELLHVRLIIAHVQRLVEPVGPHQIGDPNAQTYPEMSCGLDVCFFLLFISIEWFVGENLNRKPFFLPSNIGVSG